MGFFSDIIRDSRGTHRTFSLAEDVPVDHRQKLYFPDRSRVTDEGGRAARSAVESAPIKRLREESAGFSEAAWQDQVQAETVARQVASPSPAQYIPAGELAQVRVDRVVTPNPETREQTGSKSDETATDASRTTRTESRHGDGSFDVPEVQASASDSSIRESSSERAMSRAGTTAVETQGRQQAGENRAGLATPPGQSAQPQVVERSGFSQDQSFLRRLHELPDAACRESAAVRFAADSDRRESSNAQPRQADTSLDKSFAPAAQIPQQQPSWNPPTRRDVFTARRNDREKPSSERAQRAAVPQVQIGTIEVVVVSTAPPERSARSEPRAQPDPASRHYLRNF